MYDWIYWIIIIILAFAVSQYRKKAKAQKEKTKAWKEAYDEAKDTWASQSNAVRKKGIECGIIEKACMDWKEKYEKVEKELKELKKRLMIKIG